MKKKFNYLIILQDIVILINLIFLMRLFVCSGRFVSSSDWLFLQSSYKDLIAYPSLGSYLMSKSFTYFILVSIVFDYLMINLEWITVGVVLFNMLYLYYKYYILSSFQKSYMKYVLWFLILFSWMLLLLRLFTYMYLSGFISLHAFSLIIENVIPFYVFLLIIINIWKASKLSKINTVMSKLWKSSNFVKEVIILIDLIFLISWFLRMADFISIMYPYGDGLSKLDNFLLLIYSRGIGFGMMPAWDTMTKWPALLIVIFNLLYLCYILECKENSKSKDWIGILVIFAGILSGLALINHMNTLWFISLNNFIAFARMIIPFYIVRLIIRIIINLIIELWKYRK